MAYHKPLVIGHRGACGYEPENTLISFKKALEIGVDAIELDVHKCKSGEIVVIHDFTVDRTTSGHGKVKDKDLKDLKSLYTEKNQKIPMLQEVLDCLQGSKVKVIVELKGEDSALYTSYILKEYIWAGKYALEDFIVISFDHDQIFEFRSYFPEVKVGLSFEDSLMPRNSFEEKIKKVKLIMIDFNLITENLVQELHQNQVEIFVFTLNDKTEVNRAKLLSVDGIVSNYPDTI